jgi:predicted nucleic acid-binding protein
MLLDTSGLLCLIEQDDVRHERAVVHFESASRRTTHSLVLADLIPLSRIRGIPIQAMLRFVADLLHDPRTETYWINESHFRSGMALTHARPDKSYSLCDAVSFLLMRERGITEALTTDHHFDQEGFQRLLDR